MNGKNHERLSLTILLPTVYILGSSGAPLKLSFLFVILWLIGTFLITPDLDTYSRSRKRLGVIGWIMDMLFRHRGTLHSPVLWGVLGVIGYFGIGWYTSGLVIPQFLHIVTDWVS
ncbi:MAG TPA: hypothetical protein DCM31_08450 [Deferribacteraceae bacterium]|nr:hypothetical protein [Deferribacteraceae bacterium]